MAKMDKKWVILCSTAVAAVYTAGLLSTESGAPVVRPPSQMTQSKVSSPSIKSGAAAGSGMTGSDMASSIGGDDRTQSDDGASSGDKSNSNDRSTPDTHPTGSKSSADKSSSAQNGGSPAKPAPQKSSQHTTVKKTYKDGTFSGMGMNRRGAIQVAVTIKNDKITDVAISRYGMHYSERDIVGLPHEVLQLQSYRVRNVSGATYSTMAFEDAVHQALDHAKNA